jgi:acyl carrier protein
VVQDHAAAAETLPRSAAARLRAELESAAPRKRLDLLMNHVRLHAMSVLGLPPTFSLDAQQGLRDVGLDSLLALELRNRLQSAVESPLPATLAFDFPTVADLARHLAQNVLRLELTAPSDGPASDESARQTALDEIDELSDEMAEALLNAELSGVRGDSGERN